MILGITVAIATGCYDKYRNVDPNDPNIYDPNNPANADTVSWSWTGAAPLSGIVGGETISIDNANIEIDKIQETNYGRYTFRINSTVFGVYPRYYYEVSVKKDLSPGIHKASLTQTDRNFNFFYQKNTSLNDGKMYSSWSSTINIITNNDDIIEGYFYGTLWEATTMNMIDIKNGYFKFEKAGMIIQN